MGQEDGYDIEVGNKTIHVNPDGSWEVVGEEGLTSGKWKPTDKGWEFDEDSESNTVSEASMGGPVPEKDLDNMTPEELADEFLGDMSPQAFPSHGEFQPSLGQDGWISEQHHYEQQRARNDAIQRLKDKLGRNPTENELSQEMYGSVAQSSSGNLLKDMEELRDYQKREFGYGKSLTPEERIRYDELQRGVNEQTGQNPGSARPPSDSINPTPPQGIPAIEDLRKEFDDFIDSVDPEMLANLAGSLGITGAVGYAGSQLLQSGSRLAGNVAGGFGPPAYLLDSTQARNDYFNRKFGAEGGRGGDPRDFGAGGTDLNTIPPASGGYTPSRTSRRSGLGKLQDIDQRRTSSRRGGGGRGGRTARGNSRREEIRKSGRRLYGK